MERHDRAIYRFGPFQADAASGELLKQGKRVRLQEQPFRLLIILLENAGEVVTKAEIQNRIWEGNTFVDFDSGLRVAVGKLREALGDDAASPHYVESIPKRGYRFVGSVAAPENSITQESTAESKPAATAAPSGETRSYRWTLATGILLLVTLGALVLFFVLHRKRPLTLKDAVVLADFDNKTGDAVFDDTLRQGLAVQLEQSPFLSLVSADRIQQTLQMMGKPTDIRLSLSIARDVCQRTGSAAVLIGSIAQIGSRYLLTLEAVNCLNGDSLASTEAQAIDKNHGLDVLGKTASEIRNKLGESLSTVQKFDIPLVLATTSSLEALKAFSAGTRVMSTSGDAAALPYLKHAVELDPSFALAYAWLGIAHTSIGEPGIAASYTRKAYELRSRTSEPERYLISTIYFKEVTGNIKAAEQSCQSWGAAYPRMDTPHFYLSGAIFPVTGQYERAVEKAREAIRLNPDSPVSYAFLMFDETALGHFDEAKAAYKQAVSHKFKIPFFQLALYEIAFLEDDRAAMDKQAALSQGKPGDEDVLLSLQAETAAYRGLLKKAREISQEAIDSAERSGQRETTATYIAQSGLREALFGNAEEARKRAGWAIDRSTGRDAQYGAALALAFLGDEGHARSLTSDLARRFPEDTIVQFNYVPTLRAELAVRRGHALQAIENLEIAAPYELGATTASTYGWNAMYPAFVRGEAYLAARKGSEAAVEFQRIIDHRGIVVNEPIGAIAHLGLARAYVLEGDTTKARAAYQDFFVLWKDADSDIPILKQARDEYARLK